MRGTQASAVTDTAANSLSRAAARLGSTRPPTPRISQVRHRPPRLGALSTRLATTTRSSCARLWPAVILRSSPMSASVIMAAQGVIFLWILWLSTLSALCSGLLVAGRGCEARGDSGLARGTWQGGSAASSAGGSASSAEMAHSRGKWCSTSARLQQATGWNTVRYQSSVIRPALPGFTLRARQSCSGR